MSTYNKLKINAKRQEGLNSKFISPSNKNDLNCSDNLRGFLFPESSSKVIEKIKYPAITLDSTARNTLLKKENEYDSQVIIKITVTGRFPNDCVRIWKSTFLYPNKSGRKSKLLHAENISFYPQWTSLSLGKEIIFTLIFSRLPKACKEFDLIEQIPESGGFFIKGIKRNKIDVYCLKIN